MPTPYTYQLRRGQDGRILEKTETVAGNPVTWKYSYDKAGRLREGHLDGRLICQCEYDREGRRVRDYLPATAGPHYRNYTYTPDDRLMLAGGSQYSHDENGFRSIRSHKGEYTLYAYSPDYRLLKSEIEGGNRAFTFRHDEDGQRVAKYLNGELVEAYQWLDFVRLAGFRDGQHAYEFAYRDGERTPCALRRDDGGVAGLFYDQVGSLRVIADLEDNVIKEVLYDPFGGIIEDTNPALRVPLGFAGGLHDRDLGFVRFGWRDYDVNTGRWTGPDPLGDRGGDPDWYGYCLDDPVNLIDLNGLMGCKPQDPNENKLYPAGKGQWQASPGACEKCRALDGNYYLPGSEPDKPHPNCKCKVVECYYGAEQGQWQEYARSDALYEMPSPVFISPLTTVPVLWTKIYWVKEKRQTTTFIFCGDRKESIDTKTDFRKRKVTETQYSNAYCISTGVIDRCSCWWCPNPWVPGDIRRGNFYPGP